MKLSIRSDIALGEPSTSSGYITWLDVSVGEHGRTVGDARVAMLHVGECADQHGDLWPALRDTKLAAIHDLYFEQGWYKDDFADGAGIDLLFVDSVSVDEAFRNKNLDLAIVRRLADTVGSGCQMVVMPYRNAMEAAHWARLGFTMSTPGRGAGFMHMKLGYRHARIVETGAGDFQVLPSEGPAPRSSFN